MLRLLWLSPFPVPKLNRKASPLRNSLSLTSINLSVGEQSFLLGIADSLGIGRSALRVVWVERKDWGVVVFDDF